MEPIKVAVLTRGYRDYLNFLKENKKEDEVYTWIYRVDQTRGKRFDRIEKYYDWYEIENIDEILSELERGINYKTKPMKKTLKFLKIIQTVSNEKRYKNGLKKLGRGFLKAHRFNPYNPLSYIVIALIPIVGILMFGFVGFWKEVDCKNPFKWD